MHDPYTIEEIKEALPAIRSYITTGEQIINISNRIPNKITIVALVASLYFFGVSDEYILKLIVALEKNRVNGGCDVID